MIQAIPSDIMTEIKFKDVRSKFPLVRWVQKKLYLKNKNWLSMIVGATGSGKSWSAISLAEKIDPNFDENNIVFKPIEFMKQLTSGDWGQGSCVVFDEIGVNMSQKEFMTVTNRLMENVFETFRRRNISVIFTVPSQRNVDKDLRRLLHTLIHTQRIDPAKKRVACKWLKMQYNPRYDKIYYKYPKVLTDKSVVFPEKVKQTWIGKPSDDIIDKYESKREVFQKEMEEDTLEQIKKTLGKGSSKKDKKPSKKDRIKKMLKNGKSPDEISDENDDIDLQYARNISSQTDL